jgi:cephalosporin hydroxylase
VEEVKHEAEGLERIMVVLDSDYSEAHMAAELDMYAPLVNVG